MKASLSALLLASICPLASCSKSSAQPAGATLTSVVAPLQLNAEGTLSIGTAGTSDAGALSAADWNRFNEKVSSVAAGTGLALAGTETAPELHVVFGADATSATVGNDPRLSDARNPIAGSNAYIQNGTTPQSANLNISGTATMGGAVTAPSVQATYLVAGNGPLPVEDQLPGVLGLVGASTWTITANETPSLQIIDRTDSVRRGIFDTSGNVFLGGDIACNEGCSAGLQYIAANQTLTLTGQVSTHDGRIQRDAAYFDPEGSVDTNPVHIKTTIIAAQAAAFRLNLEGYNWGAALPIDAVCTGRFDSNGLAGGCANSTASITPGLYISSDGYLTLRASSANIAQSGFTLSAAYYFAAAQGSSLRVTYRVLRSATDI